MSDPAPVRPDSVYERAWTLVARDRTPLESLDLAGDVGESTTYVIRRAGWLARNRDDATAAGAFDADVFAQMLLDYRLPPGTAAAGIEFDENAKHAARDVATRMQSIASFLPRESLFGGVVISDLIQRIILARVQNPEILDVVAFWISQRF